jgi:hypothetical protein
LRPRAGCTLTARAAPHILQNLNIALCYINEILISSIAYSSEKSIPFPKFARVGRFFLRVCAFFQQYLCKKTIIVALHKNAALHRAAAMQGG